jgi:hypothetical protein
MPFLTRAGVYLELSIRRGSLEVLDAAVVGSGLSNLSSASRKQPSASVSREHMDSLVGRT